MGEEIGATQSTIVLPTELSALPGIFVKFNVKCDRSQLTFLPTLLLPFFFIKVCCCAGSLNALLFLDAH